MLSQVKGLLGKWLAEIDNDVVQCAVAESALSSCAVVVDACFVCGDCSEVCMVSVMVRSVFDNLEVVSGLPRRYSLPQVLQYSRLLLPWTSDILS